MNSSARGAVLVLVGVVLAFLVLRGAADNAQFPDASAASNDVAATPTADPLEISPDDTVDVTGDSTIEVDLSQARPNNEVAVLVANGSEVNGQALRLTSTLRNQAFIMSDPRNADPIATSKIYYRLGFASEAAVVRSVLGGLTQIEPMPEPDPVVGDNVDLAAIDVLVLVGADDLAQP